MEVCFISRDGTLVKPVFTQEIKDLRASMKKSSRFIDKQPEKNIKENIHIQFKGMAFPNIIINKRLFGTNLNSIYENMKSDPLDDLEEYQRRNAKRREELQIIFDMQRIGQSSNSPDKKKQKQTTPVEEIMELTGVSKSKAETLLRDCKGNIESAFNAFHYQQNMITDFSRHNQISKQHAESFLQAANFNKVFAETLYKESRR